MTKKTIAKDYAGMTAAMREAVNEGGTLKAVQFCDADNFAVYKLNVYFVQAALTKIATAAKRGEAVEEAKDGFYKAFKRLMALLSADGEVYVAGTAEAEAYLPHVGSFRKQADGSYIFSACSEAAFRKAFERTVIARIDGGEIRTAEQVREARLARAEAAKAKEKAKREAKKAKEEAASEQSEQATEAASEQSEQATEAASEQSEQATEAAAKEEAAA